MRIKQTFLTISALAALTMTANAADMPVKAPPRVVEQPPQVMGYVELYGGWARTKETETFCFGSASCDTNSASVSGWALGGAGRVTWWWAPNYSLQLDAQGEGTSYKFTGSNGFFERFSTHSYLIGGHANWRDPGRGLIGIFGGAGDTTNSFYFNSIRHGLIGAEGQVYWGPITLYGQVGYDSTLGSLQSSGFDSIKSWFVRGTARWYVTPNFRLEGTALFADGDIDFTANQGVQKIDFETWLWRVKGEYKFASSPFSIFALYEGSRTKADWVFSAGNPDTRHNRFTDNRVMGGVRLYINENTLQFNDRNGTTLDIIAPHSVPSFMLSRGGGAG